MGCCASMFTSDTPPPKEILPDPAANEAFEAYFRNLNSVYFDNWQVFKGDAHAKPTTVKNKHDKMVADNDENRWLYVKGKGNAFSTQGGTGWIVGTTATLNNFKAKPEKGKPEPNEQLWNVKFDKKRCKCEWGSDFEDPDCPVVDGFYVGDDMHHSRRSWNSDYQIKWRTTRTLVFESKDSSAAPVEVVITTTGAFHVKIDNERIKDTQNQVFSGNFCALKSVVTIDGHPPFSIDLTSYDLKYALPGEFSGAKLTEDDHKKWKDGLSEAMVEDKAPAFKTKVESGKLDSGMKLLLAFVLSFMLVEDEKGQDAPMYGPTLGPLQRTMFKMGHVFPLAGTEFGTSSGLLAKGVEWLLKEKCKGYKESAMKRTGVMGTGDFKVCKRTDYPNVAAVKLEGVQRYGY